MKSTFRGILLKKINYSENSLILQVFTREAGKQSFIFQGGKKKKGNALEALTIFDFEAYKRPESDLGKISNIDILNTDFLGVSHPLRGAISFFFTEVLIQLLNEETANTALYDELEQEIIMLNTAKRFTNYPLWILQFAAWTQGLTPRVINKESPIFFDIEEGGIVDHIPQGHLYVKDTSIAWLSICLEKTREEILALEIPANTRKQLFEHWFNYLKYHIDELKMPKSIEILSVVLR